MPEPYTPHQDRQDLRRPRYRALFGSLRLAAHDDRDACLAGAIRYAGAPVPITLWDGAELVAIFVPEGYPGIEYQTYGIPEPRT